MKLFFYTLLCLSVQSSLNCMDTKNYFYLTEIRNKSGKKFKFFCNQTLHKSTLGEIENNNFQRMNNVQFVPKIDSLMYTFSEKDPIIQYLFLTPGKGRIVIYKQHLEVQSEDRSTL